MDLIYLVNKNKSYCNEYELRWSLRSIEKYAKGVDRIFVAGVLPDFLNPDEVILVPVEQKEVHNHHEKHIQLDNTLKYVLDNYDISDEFLLSMDDHYLLKEVDYNNYQNGVKHYKYLWDYFNDDANPYHNFIAHTARLLKNLNLPINAFILHKNFKLNKNIIYELWEKYPELHTIGVETWAFSLNYQYSKNPFEFKVEEDCKLVNVDYDYIINLDRDWFSSFDMTDYCKMFKAMNKLYPNKSKYEL